MSFKQGYTPWNKGKGSAPQISAALKGRKSPWVSISNKLLTEELSRRWKGDAVGYGPLHRWVARHLGRPSLCQHCFSDQEKRYEWANISGQYKRDLSDWIRLCRSCHIRYDKQMNRWGHTRRLMEIGGSSS